MDDSLDHQPPHGHHFTSAGQERRADLLGLWLFIATEVMMFGALFMAVIVYRSTLPDAVREGAHHLNLWIGGLNTAVLLTSSMTIALAVVEARRGRSGRTAALLAATAALGGAFLGIKAYEYAKEYREGLIPGIGPAFPSDDRAVELFFNIYFTATGLHAVHLIIGVGAVLLLAFRVRRGTTRLPERRISVESLGLYWHFVDIVWVFLYPALYLVGR
ncbi:Cytochrome c oxidase polypeptide III [Caenispirillum salinarum AK4]|uniref:Cytochrome c oxidase polypeptide III n=1 Tax=Caenispirillum salinarum AK4 TaxID=1238182 RepID=K9GXN6_9PROT|nr:cytochrome c oxidase subunit 3 [Caenispirillum salinarum]EKV29539.1 Cytochrome c oxidase polypeptide III [Caenispirillum salinarum AK4]